MPSKTVAVGIDIGSYNARVAIFDDHSNHPICAHNADGRRTTRVVLPADESGDLGVGFNSKNMTPITSENLDRFITEKLIPLAHDAAHTKDLSVIASIPNDDSMPEEWIDALKKSGRGVITEAAAVCVAYDLADRSGSKHVLVIDGGASALKISSLRVTANGFWCLESTTKTDSVHGEALVETLGQSVAQQFEIKHRFPRGEVWQSKKARAKLQRACENGLTTLQINNTLTVHVDSLYEGMDCQVTISKPKWDHLSSKLVRNAAEFLRKAASDNPQIDTVVLSGNMHTWLKPMVQRAFPGKLLSSGIDPSEAVAIGCTKQANWNLAYANQSIAANIPSKLETSTSPIAISIFERGNVVIEQGTPLPAHVNYQLSNFQEEKSSEEIEIWQVKPTEKHLATLSDVASDSTIRLLLTESRKLRIAVGGEQIVI